MESQKPRDSLKDRLSHGAPLAAIVFVALATVFFIGYQALAILELIAISLLLALILRTIVNGLKRLGAPSWLAVIVLVAGIGAFATLIWFVVIPNVVREAQALINSGGRVL